jgi:hypothetical protein
VSTDSELPTTSKNPSGEKGIKSYVRLAPGSGFYGSIVGSRDQFEVPYVVAVEYTGQKDLGNAWQKRDTQPSEPAVHSLNYALSHLKIAIQVGHE